MNETSSCAIVPQVKPTPKLDKPLKKLVRRVKQAVLPTHARVRYDTETSRWAVLDSSNMPVRHFEYGLLTNVKFSTAVVSKHVARGCSGDYENVNIGIAEGDLVENTFGTDMLGFENLRFDHLDGTFRRFDSVVISEAKVVRLLPDRRAVYK